MCIRDSSQGITPSIITIKDMANSHTTTFLLVVNSIVTSLLSINASVSYTHLDVYKRQVYTFLGDNSSLTFSTNFSLVSKSSPYPTYISVSYTHLDVYKRQ